MKNYRLGVIQQTNILLISPILVLMLSSCAPMSRTSTAADAYYYFKTASPSDKRSYVQMKDSSFVYGKKANYGGEALISKKVVRLDGKSYPFGEVLALQNQGNYYLKIGEDQFAKRLIKGRITVYRRYVTYGNGSGYTVTFFQKDKGPVKQISRLSELAGLMSDCKKAYDMLNISLDELHKIARKQPYYVQTAIETYNNCGD